MKTRIITVRNDVNPDGISDYSCHFASYDDDGQLFSLSMDPIPFSAHGPVLLRTLLEYAIESIRDPQDLSKLVAEIESYAGQQVKAAQSG